MSLGPDATQPAALKLLKKEVIVQEAISPKHLEGRWYVEVQFIEHETEEGYHIGSYGLFAKTKKAALGAARIIDHTRRDFVPFFLFFLVSLTRLFSVVSLNQTVSTKYHDSQ